MVTLYRDALRIVIQCPLTLMERVGYEQIEEREEEGR